ncbi:MBL fold metallo-hydrolase RNA specificity domain-containing protein [Candidatus Omnitrophota bacterium]
MKVRFLGAAKNVTGSRHLLEHGSMRILIDCGLYQEREFRSRNWEKFPVNPSSIGCVLLTHAHIDHCGYLPKLIKDGFKGTIYCTHPTAEIAEIGLLDAGHLQEADAEFKRRRHKREGRKGAYPEAPLYGVDDAKRVPRHFKTVSYGKPIKITQDITATFYDAGHILGAAMIEIHVSQGNSEKTLIFSGDIGRWNKPILCDPHSFSKADYVFTESTYGNRSHGDQGTCSEDLARIINETHKAGGNVIIPTFATERAQELLYCMSRLLKDNKIPHLMTFLDSPMAIDVTKVFKKYPGYFDKEAKDLIAKGDSLFDFPLLKTTPTAQESKAINHVRGTAIIMSGSGMCTGGRVKHHLMHNLSRPESTILFVGYQAKGTLGREILGRPSKVRVFGQNVSVRAKIEKINGFSAHADRDELLRWLSGFKESPKKIFVLHGEDAVAEEFASLLKNKLSGEIIVGEYLKEYPL